MRQVIAECQERANQAPALNVRRPRNRGNAHRSAPRTFGLVLASEFMKEFRRIFGPLTLLLVVAGCARSCPEPQAADAPVTPLEPPTTAAEPSAAPAPAPEPASVPQPDANSFAEGQQQIVKRAAEIQFGPCPPAIPFECEMAVLEGDPRAPGLFTTRFRTKKPFVLAPHSHPRAERVTVLSGKISVGFGTTVDKSASQQFSTGDYYVNAPGVVHFVWTDEPTEIQITGMGPWEVHPHRK